MAALLQSPAPMDRHARRRAIGEIVAVVLTGGTFLAFENLLNLKLPFLIVCTLAWTAYLVWRIRRDRAVLGEWGLRRDTLLPATVACLAFLAVGATALAGLRVWMGWKPLPASSLILFAVYPIWGFIQQFVVQALVAGNLERLRAPKWAIVPVAAVLFGLAHVPDLPLSGLCTLAGLFWTPIFLWRPNLVPLAFTHAWLGTLTYYWALGRDPWGELFPPTP
jgi:hypothetical protein